ncbi:MAG: S41 family peptidase [Gloeobacterales cyanobacterium]
MSIRIQTVSRALAVGFGLIFMGHPLATHAQQTSTPKATPTTTNYSELVTRVWQTVLDRYYDPGFRGVDWQSYQKDYVRHSYAKPEQAYQAAQELLSKLQDRYTRFLTSAQFQKVAMPSISLTNGESNPALEATVLSGVGYLKLNRFNPQAAPQMAQAIQDLQGQDVTGFILDLRDNRGGLFDSAIQIAQQWLGAGVVAQVYGRWGQQQIEVAGQPLTQLPLVVLVNQSSGSASELLAGVLQERGRAKIIGMKTFGKASIQTVFTENGGSGFFVTTGHYLLPSGKDIDHRGIQPDIFVFDGSKKDQDPSLAKALSLFQKKL